MSQLKKLAGETAIYGLSSVAGRLLNYLLVPLYTAVFLPAEYGVVTELYAYVAFLNILYVFGMETAYFRFASKSPENEKAYFSSSVLFIIIISLLLSGGIALGATAIVNLLQYPGQEHYLYWLSVIMAVDAMVAIPFAHLRIRGKAIKFAIIKLSNVGLNIGFNLFFLLVLPALGFEFLGVSFTSDLGVGYVFLANLIANGMLIPMLWKELRRIHWTIDKSALRELLVYGFPMLIIGFAAVTNEMLSRAMLKYLLPEGFYDNQTKLDALGIFGACYKLSIFMNLGIQAFRYAAEPFFFNQAADKNSPKLFSQVTDKFIVFGSLVFVAICINLELLATVFLRNPAYHEGLVVVPFLLMGGLFLGIYYNLSLWYKLTDKTQYGAIISVSGALLTVVLNLILIPIMGYLGSAIVTLITYGSMTAISYVWGAKIYPVPYKVTKGLSYLILAGAMVAAYELIAWPSLMIQTICNIVLLGALSSGVYYLEFKKLSFK